MIKISKLADYAVVILSALAGGDGTSVAAADLSEQTKLPLPTVSKVLKLLAKGGVVTGARGVTGGYTLNHAPANLTVAQIVTAVDGPISITECADTQSACGANGMCHLRGRWGPVNRALITALSEVSLRDMMNMPTQHHRVAQHATHKAAQ